MKTTISILAAVAVLALSGCSTSSTSNPPTASESPSPAPAPPKAHATAFEGHWAGHDLSAQNAPATLSVSGQSIEFHGAEADDWLKGTFTLREDTDPKQFVGVISDCANSDFIGKNCFAIYKIEDGTLTVAGYSPGTSGFPPAFDAPGARELVFKHDQ